MMKGFFKTPAGWAVLVPIVGLAVLFGAGIWFMIGLGFYDSLGMGWSYLLATIVAPTVAFLSVMIFIYGKDWQRKIEDYEYQFGKVAVYDEDGKIHHYENKWSKIHLITIAKFGVLALDSAGIFYRILSEPISLQGKIILLIFGHILALAPWIAGDIVYMIVNRPIHAVRRDALQVRERAAIREEVKGLTAKKKQIDVPAHMRDFQPAQDK